MNPKIDYDLYDTLEAIVFEHGPMSRTELARRARLERADDAIDERYVDCVLDLRNNNVTRRPDGTVIHHRQVLDGVVLTHRVQGSLRGRDDLWLGRGTHPFLTMAFERPLPLCGGGEVRMSEMVQPALVGPPGWLPEAERGDLVAMRWSEGALSIDRIGPEDLAGPIEQEHVRSLVAEFVDTEAWFAGHDPDDMARRVERAVASARLVDPDLLSTPHPPLDEMFYDPFDTRASELWRTYASAKQQESVSFSVTGMPVALDSELRARAAQYAMTVDQFVIAILGHLAWRTPFAEDVAPWEEWAPERPASARAASLFAVPSDDRGGAP